MDSNKMLETLKRLMTDSESVLKYLAESSEWTAKKAFGVDRDFSTLTDQNYKDAAFYTTTVSGMLIEQLFEMRDTLQDAIDDRED